MDGVILGQVHEASLSFLGAGTPPDIPSWGTMLGPGAALMLAVLACIVGQVRECF